MDSAHTAVRNAPKLSELDQELAEKCQESSPRLLRFSGELLLDVA